MVFRGDIVKDDSGSCIVYTEQGSSTSQMTAAKVMDVISRLPGCAGQAADAISDGQWHEVTENMMINFVESGHPMFLASSALERGEMKCEVKGLKPFISTVLMKPLN